MNLHRPRLPHLRDVGLAPRLVVLAVLLSSVTGGAVAVSTIGSARTALRDQILASQLAMTDLVAAQSGEYVADVQQDAEDLVASDDLRAATFAGDVPALDDQLERWTALGRGRVDAAVLYSRDGLQMAISRPDKSGNGNVKGQSSVTQIIASGLPALAPAVRARGSGMVILPYLVPIQDENGTVRAVLSVAISVQSLSDFLLALPLHQHTRISIADNSSGLVLVHSDPGRVLQTLSGQNEAGRRARSGERGAQENVSSSGELTLAAFSPVPELPWAVVIQESSSDAFAPIDQMTRTAELWVMVSVLLAAGVAAALALSLVRPLRKLHATAERMASGDLRRRTGVLGGDEIGHLGRAFDRMAEQLQDSVDELTRQAQHDAVTGLPNRVLLRQRLDQAMQAESSFALLVMDLDRFKDVNDTLGHPAGDDILRQVGERLRHGLRANDTVARLGGDEFAVLLPGVNAADAVATAEQLLRLIEVPFDLRGHAVTIGTSVGIADWPQHGADADTLLQHADVAMYVAKRADQGVARYAPEQDEHTPDRLALIAELREALATNQLTLAFQPLLDCRRDVVIGVEALARWPHPRRGLIPPDQFIPVAEQTGLIKPLSRWVLDAALRQYREWRRSGLDVPVSVNLSMRDLQDVGLPDTVAALLAELEVSPCALRVEITESSLMSDPGRALETLSRLCAMGIAVSVDDFGTGYSSLAYLKQLPVDELKIDQSFVHDMASDESDLAIVRSTIDLGHSLGLRVVAEGVEDGATLDLLRDLGCDKAQGYFFSRPMFADDATRWLSRWPDCFALDERAA